MNKHDVGNDMKPFSLSPRIWIFLILLFSLQFFVRAQEVWPSYPDAVNSNSMTVEFRVVGEAPEFVGVVMQTNDPIAELQEKMKKWQEEWKTNHSVEFPNQSPPPTIDFNTLAKWIPFRTNLIVDLGPGDGKREVLFGYRYPGQARCDRWGGGGVDVIMQSPQITANDPQPGVVFQPTILIKGYISDYIESIRYDVYDKNGTKTVSNAEAEVNDVYYDPTLSRITTNYFTCYEVPLTPGTNTIVIRCVAFDGNNASTNLTYVLDSKKTAPVIFIEWPGSGMSVPSTSLSVRGRLDDGTENIVGEISANRQTNIVNGEVGWDHKINNGGYFFVENVPISPGANYLTLTATDVAGHSSSTNLVLYGVSGPIITMNPVTPADKLWQSYVDITGKVEPANNNVWVNGVKAAVNADGTWLAKHVPVVSANVGTACFDMTSVPPQESLNKGAEPKELFFAQTDLGTNMMTINPSIPVCGIFQLHVNDSMRQSFVLYASTNLIGWSPILTNLNPNSAFDYTDTNAGQYGCRFFRVAPLR